MGDGIERNSRRIVKRLVAEGFELVAVRGSHHKFVRQDLVVIVPPQERPSLGHCPQHSAASWLDKIEMSHYIAIVHKDEDSAFGISFPDLPGCFSAADTADEILPNAMEALELWSEGMAQMPAPSPLDTFRGNSEIAADLAAGAFLISVPFIRNLGKTARVNITLDKGLLDAIDSEAERRKMTRSALLAQAALKEISG
jgi:predicted RNase H-like HicB family nuclease/predicted RNA binding protein YcfA (HicA-like mRNA interferase family)